MARPARVERVLPDEGAELDAKQRLIEAGVSLFGSQGLTAPTVRDITDLAKCNMAAINYYYGSRDDFLKKVLLHVLQPVREGRDRSLKAALERHDGHPVPVHELVDAWVDPLLDAPRDKDGGRIAVRFMQHLWADPAGKPLSFIQESYDYSAHAYIEAFGSSLPSFTRAEIVWRYEMMRGAALRALADCDPASPTFGRLMSGGRSANVEQTDLIRQQIVTFCAAGFMAHPIWSENDLENEMKSRVLPVTSNQ